MGNLCCSSSNTNSKTITQNNISSNIDSKSNRNEFYNLKGKIIPKLTDGYYNLQTNRINKNKNPELIYDDKYKICGIKQDLYGFYEINHISSKDMILENIDFQKNIPDSNYEYSKHINQIENIPDLYLNQISHFNLVGLRTMGKIVNIIDADTIDLVIYVPLEFLIIPKFTIQKYTQKSGYKQDEKSDFIQSNLNNITLIKIQKTKLKQIKGLGFYMKFRCRLNNIDSAESSTLQGKLATQLMVEKYKSLNNIVYVDCFDFDKYGRLLVDLYEDSSYNKYLNYHLIDYKSNLGILVVKYDGKTKSDYMKKL